MWPPVRRQFMYILQVQCIRLFTKPQWWIEDHDKRQNDPRSAKMKFLLDQMQICWMIQGDPTYAFLPTDTNDENEISSASRAAPGFCVRCDSESGDSHIPEERVVYNGSQEEHGRNVREQYQTPEERVTLNALVGDGKLIYRYQGLTCATKNSNLFLLGRRKWVLHRPPRKLLDRAERWVQFGQSLPNGASTVPPSRICCIEWKNDLKTMKKILMNSGGALETEDLEEDVQKWVRYMEDEIDEVRKWITKVPYDVCKGLTKACQEDRLEEGDLTQWTRTVIGRIWSQVLEDVEARLIFIKSIMWRSTESLGLVVAETEERGVITFTYVCEHCTLFPVEGFLWWVSADHGEGRKENSMSGRGWRKSNRLLTLQSDDTANEHVIFPAYRAPDGEYDNSALKLFENRMKGSKLGVIVKGSAESSKNRLAKSVKWKAFVIIGELTQFRELRRKVSSNFNKGIHASTLVTEGEEVLTLRPENRGRKSLSWTRQESRKRNGTAVMTG